MLTLGKHAVCCRCLFAVCVSVGVDLFEGPGGSEVQSLHAHAVIATKKSSVENQFWYNGDGWCALAHAETDTPTPAVVRVVIAKAHRFYQKLCQTVSKQFTSVVVRTRSHAQMISPDPDEVAANILLAFVFVVVEGVQGVLDRCDNSTFSVSLAGECCVCVCVPNGAMYVG